MCRLCKNLNWSCDKIIDLTFGDRERYSEFEKLCFGHYDMVLMRVGNIL